MIVDKEYFDGWMQRLVERLKRIEVRFIECNFSNFRKLKKERANYSPERRQ